MIPGLTPRALIDITAERDDVRRSERKRMIEWNDLQTLLAISRAGNLVAAAKGVGVTHSTMYRRLNALEEELGVTIFKRFARGYRLTEPGQRLIDVAERMEYEVLSLGRDLGGRSDSPTGTLHVTAPEPLAFSLLAPEIAHFQNRHASVDVELVVGNRLVDHPQTKPYVAFRTNRPVRNDLFGRKLSDVAWSVYGSADYLIRNGTPADVESLKEHAIIGWTASDSKPSDWLTDLVPEQARIYRTNSQINQLVAAKAGIGLTLLPCYMGDRKPLLKRVALPIPALVTELWMVTHLNLQTVSLVRTLWMRPASG